MKFAPRIAGLMLALTAVVHAPDAAAYSQMIAFGDSLTDDGNLLALVGAPGAPYYQGRFSNGIVAAEVMANQLGLNLTDYAYGGAQTGTGNLVGSFLNGTGIQGQIGQFGGGLSQARQAVDASALYFVWGGPNDFFAGQAMLSPTTAITAANNVRDDITDLYNLGARDFFVPLMPDLGVTPSARATNALSPGFSVVATADSLAFNGLLSSNLAALSSSLTGIHIQTFDTLSFQHQQIQALVAQGYNVTDQCFTGSSTTPGTVCADPSHYLFWDGVHPTAIAHEALGQAFAQAAAVPEPSSWLMLIVGMSLLLAWSARRRASANPMPAKQAISEA